MFQRVRAVYDAPVIMLTSQVNEVDRVVGLGNLRRKIEGEVTHPKYVRTVFGVGYKMVDAG